MDNYFKTIKHYDEPREILDHLEIVDCEMTKNHHGFLCGLIKEKRPRKLLEVGVAGGGTTAVVMHCLDSLDLDSTMYSVDLSERYYRDQAKRTGWELTDLKSFLPNIVKHEFKLGCILPQVIDEIGHNIDFVILDTAHSVPGEILDFICVLPYLTENATVVLHDVTAGTENNVGRSENFATQILFDAATAVKYWEFDREDGNIAALDVGEKTRECIADIFAALSVTWSYLPSKKELDLYTDCYTRFYDEECIRLWKVVCQRQQDCSERTNISTAEERDFSRYLQLCEKKDIYIYGAGKGGKNLLNYLDENGVEVKGFVVSDEEKDKNQEKVMNVTVYKKSEYLKMYNSKEFILLYGLRNQQIYYELLSEGINCWYVPIEYLCARKKL